MLPPKLAGKSGKGRKRRADTQEARADADAREAESARESDSTAQLAALAKKRRTHKGM